MSLADRLLEALSSGKLEVLQRQFPNYADQIEAIVLACDPTPSANFATWIMRVVKNGTVVMPEDGHRVKETLTTFEEVKRAAPAGFNKDINSSRAFPDLYDAVQALAGAKSRRNFSKVQQEKGAREAYNADGRRVIEITTVEAAATWLRSTGWCVKDPQYARQYLAKGSLWLLIVGEERHALAQFNGSDLEFRDPSDRGLDVFREPVENVKAFVEAAGRATVLSNLDMAVYWSLAMQEPIDDRTAHRLLYAPQTAIFWCEQMGQRWDDLEHTFMQDPLRLREEAKEYAKRVIKGPWPEFLEAVKRKEEAEKQKREAEKAAARQKRAPSTPTVPEEVVAELGNGWRIVKLHIDHAPPPDQVIYHFYPDTTLLAKYGITNMANWRNYGGSQDLDPAGVDMFVLAHQKKGYAVFVDQKAPHHYGTIEWPMVWKNGGNIPEEYLLPFVKTIVKTHPLPSVLLINAVLQKQLMAPEQEATVIKGLRDTNSANAKTDPTKNFQPWAAKYSQLRDGGWPEWVNRYLKQGRLPDYAGRTLGTYFAEGGQPWALGKEIFLRGLESHQNDYGHRVEGWPDEDLMAGLAKTGERIPEFEAAAQGQLESEHVGSEWMMSAFYYWRYHQNWQGIEPLYRRAAALDRSTSNAAGHLLRYCLAKGERWPEMEPYMFRNVVRIATDTGALCKRYGEEFGVDVKAIGTKKKEIAVPAPPSVESVRRFLALVAQ